MVAGDGGAARRLVPDAVLGELVLRAGRRSAGGRGAGGPQG